MEISNLSQTAGQVPANAQLNNTQEADGKKTIDDDNLVMQKDFQVDLNEGVKTKLVDFANLLQSREELIKSLPENIRKAVVELLQQMSSDVDLSQGLSSLLTGQKNIAEQLKNMSNLLDFTAVLNKEENGDVKAFLQTVIENVMDQLDTTPEQSAKELLQLAKQLSATTTVPQSDFKQAVKEYLQEQLPEKMQQLSGNDQKIVNQLTKLLAKDMPAQLQQLAQQNNLPELPGVWSTLKVVDAWPFKDIQPKTLQAAADLLQQIAQEISPENNTTTGAVDKNIKNLPTEVNSKATVMTQLEQFVKNLPAEVNSKAAIMTQLEQFVKDLPAEANSKAEVMTQLEQFDKDLPVEVNSKATVMTQLDQFVKNLPTEVSSKTAVVTQLEQFVESLPTEVGNKVMANPKLEQFLETLPPEIGKALQQVLKQENIPNNLRSLAETFSNAAVLNEHMTGEQQSFGMKLVENFAGKSPSMPAETNDILTQLATKFSDVGTTIEQIKLIVKELKTQLLTGDSKTLEKELNSLDKLTKLFEENIPQALQEGAAKHKLADLPKMWALLKSLGTEQWQDTETQNLQKSATLVKELAQSIYKSTGATGEKQVEHSILSFSVPLQVAAGIYYPAHIHIYHQEKDENSGQSAERQFETWLRICVDTENIGIVDSVFRLYGENKLDVRVTFPSTVAADEFSQNLPNIRKNLDESSLDLTEIMVNHG